jgi:hypothetical protein
MAQTRYSLDNDVPAVIARRSRRNLRLTITGNCLADGRSNSIDVTSNVAENLHPQSCFPASNVLEAEECQVQHQLH